MDVMEILYIAAGSAAGAANGLWVLYKNLPDIVLPKQQKEGLENEVKEESEGLEMESKKEFEVGKKPLEKRATGAFDDEAIEDDASEYHSVIGGKSALSSVESVSGEDADMQAVQRAAAIKSGVDDDGAKTSSSQSPFDQGSEKVEFEDPTLHDVDSLYELGGWMTKSTSRKIRDDFDP